MDKQMNQRSLDNLRLPKEKRDTYALPQEKIDELFTLLAQGKRLKEAAKDVGICFQTAHKYFKKGDARRGIKPLEYRLSIFQDRISERLNTLVEEERLDHLSQIKEMLEAVKDNIMKKDNDGKYVNLSKIGLRDYERLVKLQMHLMGGVTVRASETKTLTMEQMMGQDD